MREGRELGVHGVEQDDLKRLGDLTGSDKEGADEGYRGFLGA